MKTLTQRAGLATLAFARPPVVAAVASVAGRHEGAGPLGAAFDRVLTDDLQGEKSWERCEARMLEDAVDLAVQRLGWTAQDLDLLLAGDLLNQIISANFAARSLAVPFLGVYSACASYCQALGIGAALISGGYFSQVGAATVSHHLTAERQLRYPVELGVQRTPTQQWTVTAAGAAVLAQAGKGPRLTHATFGKVVDMGLKDPNDMGAAMAPAARATILRHLDDTGRTFADYDLIVTGDLARVGLNLLTELLAEAGHDPTGRLEDCGVRIYSPEQDVHSGGSGAGCASAVFAAHYYPQLQAGHIRRLLLVATGALHSPTSYQQGETIPTVAHAVAFEAEGT